MQRQLLQLMHPQQHTAILSPVMAAWCSPEGGSRPLIAAMQLTSRGSPLNSRCRRLADCQHGAFARPGLSRRRTLHSPFIEAECHHFSLPQQAADESVLTPRFYTTDFDEMEQLFSQDLNPNLDMAELEVGVDGSCISNFLCRSLCCRNPLPLGMPKQRQWAACSPRCRSHHEAMQLLMKLHP